MGAADHADMRMSFSELMRKSVKWYKKLFFHLLNMAVYNAFVIYKMQNNTSYDPSDFRLEIIRRILTKYRSEKTNCNWKTIDERFSSHSKCSPPSFTYSTNITIKAVFKKMCRLYISWHST